MKKCLYCLSSAITDQHYCPGLILPDSGGGGGHLIKDEEKDKRSSSLVEEEVDYFYFIHKFLGLSSQVCEGLLQAHGSPSTWFSLCHDCHSAFLLEGRGLFNQIQELQKCLHALKEGALGRMRVKVEKDVTITDDEEEEVMTGINNVFVLDPAINDQEDDDAMTLIRSYLLPPSDESSASVSFDGDDDDDDGPEEEGEMEVFDNYNVDIDDVDYVPMVPSPSPPVSPSPRRRPSTRGKERKNTAGILKKDLKKEEMEFEVAKIAEDICRRSERERRKAKAESSKFKLGEGRNKVVVSEANDEKTKTATKPVGMTDKQYTRAKRAARRKNPRPKGMPGSKWRLVQVAKGSSWTKNLEENGGSSVKKLSCKEKRRLEAKHRIIDLAAKLEVKRRVDEALKDGDDEVPGDKKKRVPEKCFDCKPRNLPLGMNVEDHIRRVHAPPEVLPCGGCGQVIFEVKKYLEHVLTAELESPFSPCVTSALPCPHPDCDGKSPRVVRGNPEALAVHCRTAHYVLEVKEKGKKYKCHLCGGGGKDFNTKARRDVHVQADHIDQPIKCDRPNCGAVLRGKDRIRKHVNVHLVEEKVNPAFLCPECGKQFKDMPHLSRHRKLHSQDTPYICQECGKGYKVWDQLRIHMWTHDKELYTEKYGQYKQNALKRKAATGTTTSSRRRFKQSNDNSEPDKDEEQLEEPLASSSSSSSSPTAEIAAMVTPILLADSAVGDVDMTNISTM